MRETTEEDKDFLEKLAAEPNPRAECVIQGISEMMCSAETPPEMHPITDRFCKQELYNCHDCDKPIEACESCPGPKRKVYLLHAIVNEIDGGDWMVRAYRDKDRALRIAHESTTEAKRLCELLAPLSKAIDEALDGHPSDKEAFERAWNAVEKAKIDNPHKYDPEFHHSHTFYHASVTYHVIELDLE